MTFSILVPPTTTGSTKRRPLYVSSATQSIRFTINGGPPVVLNVVAGSPGCTTTPQGTQCSVNASAPVGVDTLAVALFGQINAAGPILSQGAATATVVMGAANTIAVTLSGVVAKIIVVLGNSAPVIGVATTIPLTVTMQDASGATIIGDPFANPVTLSDSDGSGATSLNRTALTSPSDAVGLTVAYSGAAVGPVSFGASASGVAPGSITVATLTPATPTPTPSPTPTPTPTPPPSTSFVDWTTYGFDNHRDGFNPSSGAFTPASLGALHLSWQQIAYNNDNATQSQPVLATNVGSHAGLVFVGGKLGVVLRVRRADGDAGLAEVARYAAIHVPQRQVVANGDRRDRGVRPGVAHDLRHRQPELGSELAQRRTRSYGSMRRAAPCWAAFRTRPRRCRAN